MSALGGRVRQVFRNRLPVTLSVLLGLSTGRPGLGAAPPLEPPPIETMYGWLASGDLPAVRRHLQAFLRGSTRSGADEIEGVVVAILAVIGFGDRRRTEGLLRLFEASYSPADREIAISRMGPRVAAHGPASPELEEVAAARTYDAFAIAVRAAAETMPLAAVVHSPREERFRRAGRRPPLSLGRRPPVVVIIRDGLGNQLFMYAAARAFARRTGGRLLLDLDWYSAEVATRELLLDRFRLPVRKAGRWDRAAAHARRHVGPSAGIDAFMFEARAPAFIRGYWQDTAYFEAIEPEIRRAFRPRDPALGARAAAAVAAARSGGGEVVAMHIRRGDRAPGAGSATPGSTLPPAYFRECASRFPAGTTFFVFSDTPSAIECRREDIAPGDGYHFAFSDSADPVLDLLTIAACDHAIIAASTFSWWGAWLGERPGRRVLVPDPYQSVGANRIGLEYGLPVLPGWEVVPFTPVDRCFGPP